MTEIPPFELFERTFKRWYWIALAVVIFGGVGWLTSYAFHPIYEARATVTIHIDSPLWGQELKLNQPSEIQLNNVLQPVIDVLRSDEVASGVITAAHQEGIEIDQDFFLTRFSVQRIYLNWEFTVRADTPQTAARLADIWSQVALSTLQQGHEHALSAYGLEQGRAAVAKCFDGADLAAANACAHTSFTSPTDLQSHLLDLDAGITAERAASLGLDPALTVELVRSASIPDEPIRYRRSWLTLAGSLIGLLLGITAAQGKFPTRKKNVHPE